MIYFVNLSAGSFSMTGNDPDVPEEVFPKSYEADTIDVRNSEEEPRVTIRHNSLPRKLVSMKRFDEITIDEATFLSAKDAADAFNVMMKTEPIA